MYEIQQQQQQQQINFKLIQTFPQEHPSSVLNYISCLLQINPNTLVSSASHTYSSLSPSDNVIVIWSKSKSSPLYEPIQKITEKETGGKIDSLVLMKQKKEEEEEEEEFASSSRSDESIIIWRRGKGEGDKFRIKQKIKYVNWVDRLLYISQTNELISASDSGSPYLLQIWSSPSSSSSSSSSASS